MFLSSSQMMMMMLFLFLSLVCFPFEVNSFRPTRPFSITSSRVNGGSTSLFLFQRIKDSLFTPEAEKLPPPPLFLNEKGEKLETVFWLPFQKESITRLSLETLNNYLTLYVLSLKDVEFGRDKSKDVPNEGVTAAKLGSFRVRPEDINKEITNQDSPDSCSFRCMYLQNFPDKNGTFGVSDLQFLMYEGGMRDGEQPGFLVLRYRPAKTKESLRAELQLVEMVLQQIEDIDQDESIDKEKRLFAIEGGFSTIETCRQKYLTSRLEGRGY